VSLSYALLGFAEERPRYPYAMKQAFEGVFGDFWPLNYGQVHQTLEALTKKNLLAKSPDPQDPSRNIYAITAAGSAELAAWRAEVGKVKVRPLRDDIFLRLHMYAAGGHEDDAFRETLHEYRIEHAKHLRKLTLERSIQDRTPVGTGLPVERLLIEAAVEHAEADVRWLDRVALALDGDIDFEAEAGERVRLEEASGRAARGSSSDSAAG